MASDTNIKKPKSAQAKGRVSPARDLQDRHFKDRRQGPRRPTVFSRLARFIFLSNLIGLLILVAGALTMQRFTKGLVAAKLDNLSSQAELITTIMGDTATGYGLAAELDVSEARDVLSRVKLPDRWRIRLHDKSGTLIADSQQFETDIAVSQLAPIVTDPPPPVWHEVWRDKTERWARKTFHELPWRVKRRDRLRHNLTGDIRKACLLYTSDAADE